MTVPGGGEVGPPSPSISWSHTQRGFRGFSRFLGGASRGRGGAWCGLTAGEHARSFWLFRASRPIHPSCPRTTVCADVMRVGSRSRVVIPAPAWSKQIKDRLSGVAPYRYPPATSSRFHGHLQWMESQFTCTGRRRSLFFVRGLSSYLWWWWCGCC